MNGHRLVLPSGSSNWAAQGCPASRLEPYEGKPSRTVLRGGLATARLYSARGEARRRQGMRSAECGEVEKGGRTWKKVEILGLE